MIKRVKNIATTEERNNTLWKTVSQGASFTPWRTFENSTCLSGTKIKQSWSDITGLVKHCCPPRLTLSHWRNEFPTYQLCSYPTTMEGLYLFKTHKFLTQRKREQHFSLWPAYPSSNVKHRNYAAACPQFTTQHCRYALWAKWQLRGTQIPQILKKPKKDRHTTSPRPAKISDPRCTALSVCYHNSHHMGITIDTRWLHFFLPSLG